MPHERIHKALAPVAALTMVVAILSVTGCLGGGGGGGGTGNTVSISNLAFVPATITVNAGTTITWTNNDNVLHTVTNDTGSSEVFDSGSMSQGSHFSHTFSTVGTFHYHCTFHTFMLGTVIVQ